MIKFYHSYQTPNMLKRQKHLERSLLALSIVLIICSALGSAGCATKNIYPLLRADTHVLVRKWTLQTHDAFLAGDRGAEFSNPIILENTLVFGNQSQGLVSLYPGLRQIRWSLPIPKGVISELNSDKNFIYFGGGDGFLYAVDHENGRVKWRYDLHNAIISRPTLYQGRIFVNTTDDTVFALDAGTGKWLWHYKRRTVSNASILGASAPLVDGNEVLVGLSDGFLIALSLQEGQLKWEKKLHTGSKFTDIDAHPVIEEDNIYVPSYDGALYALKRKDGSTIWRHDAGGSKQVVIEKDIIYLPSSEGKIFALQKQSGKMIWKFDLNFGTPTKIVTTERYLIFGSSHRYLYVLEKGTGKPVYRFDAGYDAGFYGSPYYDLQTNKLYLLSTAGNLYAFSLRQPPRKIMAHGMIDPYDFN